MRVFEKYHPIVLFSYFAVIIFMTMFFMHPVYLAITLIGAMSLNLVLNGRDFFKSLKMYIPVFLLIMIINPLISHNGEMVLFYMNDNRITLEAILYGLAMATMLVSVMLWCSCYNSVMTSDKFLYLFSRVSPVFSLVLSITMRLIPRFTYQLKLIGQSQKTIGMDYTIGSLWHRIRCIMQILSILITWALENAIETADSMKARGYGLQKRTTFSLFVFEKRDGILLAVIFLLFVISGIGSLLGSTTFYFYPALTGISSTLKHLFFYSVYAMLIVIPVGIELVEGLKWRYLKSTM
ncbi:energy-coupling factor transport system permease protein [Paenibacillus castaneae]|uniref:energy-coupling factor transporter transmembrane component T n=1 Tax=Paenibacillus castaneae TaxID=474957 RepID=UPI000C9AC547|nr:energy-coupling factor transporter transmembrane component T [Paenibacillus castaneae]NIK77195.1 energy-coupling factor transport system permease protein [Paenibacillus castaneae]